MKKVFEFTEKFLKDFNIYSSNNRLPQLEVESKNKGFQESYESSYSAGLVKIKAESSIGAAYGVIQLTMAIKTGYLPEYIGSFKPHFNLRMLWIGCNKHIKLTENANIHFPHWLDENKIDTFCQRMIELGYNSVLFAARSKTEILRQELDVQKLFCKIKEYGLKIAVQATSQNICDFAHLNVDYFFCECVTNPEEVRKKQIKNESTYFEELRQEMAEIEKKIPSHAQLLLYVSMNENNDYLMKWLMKLIDSAGPKTVIVFSATSGDPCLDHLPPHQLWDLLRYEKITFTPLIPIINSGMVKQGEGLWPLITMNTLEHLSQCQRHHFEGTIVCTNYIPPKGGMLDCNLWVTSQLLWRPNVSASFFVEMWFKENQSSFSYSKYKYLFQDIEQITREISLMLSTPKQKKEIDYSKEYRIRAENILARLKKLNFEFQQFDNQEKTSLSNYFTAFSRDIKAMLGYSLQQKNVLLPLGLFEDDKHSGFWASIIEEKHLGLRGGIQIALHSEPKSAQPGSFMEAILDNNRI